MRRDSARARIILSRETLIATLAVLLAAAICVGLGIWQYGRFETKRDAAAVVRANYSADPVALDELLPDPTGPLASEDEWAVAELSGHYCTDPECVLYVRNRPLDGEVGFWQLAPFLADDGTEILVVRGWVRSEDDSSQPQDPPAVPEGQVDLQVRLRPAEPVLEGRRNPEGQVQTVTPTELAPQLPASGDVLVTQAYGELAQEDPEAPRPHALEPPDTSLGSHLSYAFQWWVFALFFPGALVYRTRRLIQEEQAHEQESAAPGPAASPTGSDGESQEADAQQDESAATSAGAGGAASTSSRSADGRRRRRPGGRPTTPYGPRRGRSQDEEEEDALIDQQKP